ncbi:fumarylacetoacetate hydrolase family protein [Candidatus Berkiella cookevillensis]|uniref:Fumarylacetoacetate (FAA) hydrolase family protein n=1 Tax=Candidatus Berkiella cookevillensis TaxID=437022 RepID=A0A0Q9YS01_9GAMM|nr:fumarylacetoacetate hydrolase family protein [Candidatus Berkiella cookevillensis]MCS5707611.1 fumarylacetoacetate hydrolase family protein [Candidatus Berkiella cookevillensis]
MKLATLQNNTRDGELVVVSKDLKKAVRVPDIAHTLQYAVDNWHTTEAHLQEIYQALNKNMLANAFEFNPTQAHAPLPRAYQWADGSAYVNHVELVRKARGAELPKEFWTDPLMYQGGSDHFLAPHQPIQIADEAWGIDFEAEVAVITNDTPMGVSAHKAEQSILLLMLVNDVSLRNLIPQELAKGFGFFHSKPSSTFSPVAVTPDELGEAWDGKKVHLPLLSTLNGKLFGSPNAGIDMTFDFPTLIAHAAKTRPLVAGSIIGSGTVSNMDRSKGSSCIAEKRMLEILESGHAQTNFMQFGDSIRIEMLDKDQLSIFGAIEQRVEKYSHNT